MEKKPKYIEWEDCIHIAACRRFAKIVEAKTGKKLARGCGQSCGEFTSKRKMADELTAIANDIEDHKRFLREEISTQLYGIADNNDIISCSISSISTDGIQEFINDKLKQK